MYDLSLVDRPLKQPVCSETKSRSDSDDEDKLVSDADSGDTGRFLPFLSLLSVVSSFSIPRRGSLQGPQSRPLDPLDCSSSDWSSCTCRSNS